MTSSVRIGVVLSSGGGRGVYAHTGFLLALQELGVEISAIAGCSAGALVGSVAASGSNLEQWAEVIANVHTKEYWTPDPWAHFIWQLVVNKGRGYTGLSSTDAPVAFCRRNLAVQTFEQCRVPFYCPALNLGRSEKTLFMQGELAPRIMASAAMPVLYQPVEIEHELYTDGAIIELTPAEAICCKHELDVLIVHHSSLHREGREGAAWAARQPWALVEILYLLLYRQRPWYLSDEALAFHRCPGECGAPIVVLEPDLPELTWPLHTGGCEVQAAARAQTRSLLRPYADVLSKDPQFLSSLIATGDFSNAFDKNHGAGIVQEKGEST